MSDKKTKMDCRLSAIGTDKANAKVVEDLTVPDPEPAIGKKIIDESMDKEVEKDSNDVDSKETSG